MRILAALALVGCVATSQSPAPPDGKEETPPPLRNALLANLIAQMDRGTVMFGHQRFNITGVAPDGAQWLATEDAVDRSDAKSVTGQDPIVMGLDAWDLAIKPASWAPTPAVHAAAAKRVYAQGGIVTLDWHLRGCAATDSFNAAGNEACLCKLANDDTYAREWLIKNNYAKLADALVATGLDQIPIVFRPLHELDSNWFWWGQPYWNCADYVANPAVTGSQAFQRVYRMIVEYLRVERGLDNLLFAYAPSHATTGYLSGYPGDAYVDVLGLDLYYQGQPSLATQTAAFRAELDMLAHIAYDHGKAAALTEVGDTQIATDGAPWFTQQLLPLLRGSHLAYALTWENRRNAPQEFWLPYAGHPGATDVRAFAADPVTWLSGDAPNLYVPPTDGFAICTSCSVDHDIDGWGLENGASCRVGSWCLWAKEAAK